MSQLVSGVNAYKKVGLETKVAAASPQRLIELLFDGAVSAIGRAIVFLRDGDVASMGQSINKANAIVLDGLLGSLNKEKGSDVADNLASLYEYISMTLLKANIHKSEEMLVEAKDLLSGLGDAWKESTKSFN